MAWHALDLPARDLLAYPTPTRSRTRCAAGTHPVAHRATRRVTDPVAHGGRAFGRRLAIGYPIEVAR
ncbi:hypothetical protein GCM10010972_27540 [Cellulomonas carbonis]|nr:hypothetical protein GCM10010972_27540 [Cellulomonas carbonis]